CPVRGAVGRQGSGARAVPGRHTEALSAAASAWGAIFTFRPGTGYKPRSGGRKSTMKRTIIWVVALCAVAAAAGGLYYYYQSRADQTPAPAGKFGKGGKGGRGSANVPVVAAPATTADVGVLLDG